jgi:hypothetical protein
MHAIHYPIAALDTLDKNAFECPNLTFSEGFHLQQVFTAMIVHQETVVKLI